MICRGAVSSNLLFLLVSSLWVRAITGLTCGLGVPTSKLLPEFRALGLVFSFALDFFSFFFFPSFSFVFVVVVFVIVFVTFVNELVLECVAFVDVLPWISLSPAMFA